MIPFSIMPMPIIRKFSILFRGWGNFSAKLKPNLKNELKQADMDYDPGEYLSHVFASTTFNIIFFSIFYYFFIIHILKKSLNIAILMVFFTIFFFFYMQLSYPKVAILRRAKKIEAYLLPALRSLLLRLRSGISLYESMKGVAKQDFGLVSEEFQRTINEIEGGTPMITAIERMSFRNPSKTFRRVAWQIANAIRAGVSIQSNIQSIVDTLSKEQVLAIKNYGAQLNPLAMMYLMLTVILPTLGVTFLIIMGSFFGFEINAKMFFGISILLFVFQFFFMITVKSKRPNVII